METELPSLKTDSDLSEKPSETTSSEQSTLRRSSRRTTSSSVSSSTNNSTLDLRIPSASPTVKTKKRKAAQSTEISPVSSLSSKRTRKRASGPSSPQTSKRSTRSTAVSTSESSAPVSLPSFISTTPASSTSTSSVSNRKRKRELDQLLLDQHNLPLDSPNTQDNSKSKSTKRRKKVPISKKYSPQAAITDDGNTRSSTRSSSNSNKKTRQVPTPISAKGKEKVVMDSQDDNCSVSSSGSQEKLATDTEENKHSRRSSRQRKQSSPEKLQTGNMASSDEEEGAAQATIKSNRKRTKRMKSRTSPSLGPEPADPTNNPTGTDASANINVNSVPAADTAAPSASQNTEASSFRSFLMGLGSYSVGGSSGLTNRLKTIYQQLSSDDQSFQLVALQELAEALSVATEEQLIGVTMLTSGTMGSGNDSSSSETEPSPTEENRPPRNVIDGLVKQLVRILDPATQAKSSSGSGPSLPPGLDPEIREMIQAGLLDPAALGIDMSGGMGSADGQGMNPELLLLACRCMTNLMEALPSSAGNIVYAGGVKHLVGKLQNVEYIDLAEVVLSTLEKISVEYPSAIVKSGGLVALLQYLDFFSTNTQRSAMTTAANCCRNIPLDCYDQLKEVAPILQTTLNSSDQKVLESSCFCWVRIAEGLRWKVDKLEGVMSDSLLKKILEILASVSGSTSAASTSSAAPQTPSTPSSAPTVSSSTQISNTPIHTHLLRFLSTVTRSSPNISFSLVKLNLVETLHMVITGRSSADFDVTDVDNDSEDQVDEIDQMEEYDLVNAVLSRPKEWIVDVLGVVSEILPALPKDGIFNTKLNSAESALLNGIATAAGDSAGSRHTVKSEAKVEGNVNDSDVVADSTNLKTSEDKKETEANELKKDAMNVDYQTGNEGDDEQEPVDSTEDKAKGEDVEKEGENDNGDEHPAEGYPHDEEISSEEDHDSYSEDELPASPTRPISDSTVMSVQALNDQRVKLLHENMDIVTKFNSVFLPLLIHVFEASVNLRVRQRVMTAVLKIVCWTEEKRLVGVVRNVAFASFLANILSQKEHSTLVVAALQLASLMMEKLPEIYQTHFRRQGVMHEIESISTTSVDSANVATTSTDAPTVASPTTAFSNPPSSTVALAMSRQLESLVKNLNKVKISARQLVKSRPPSGLTESEESAQDQGDELMETDDNSNIMLRKNLDQLQKALLEATEAVDEAESYAERNSKKEQKKKEIEKADTEKETDAIQSVEADERMSDNTEDKSDDKQKGKAKVPTSAEASSSGSVPTESDNITATSQGSESSKARLESLKTNIQKLQNQTLTLLRSSPYYTSLASPNPSSSSYPLYNSSGDGPGLGSAQIRDWIIHTSKDFIKKYNHQATVTKAETIMNDLKQIAEVVSQTKAERGSQTVNSALLKLRDHLRSGEDTMSSFEFLGSGVLLALVQFFTAGGDDHTATDQIDRLKSFADIFMSNEFTDAKSDNHRPFAHLIKRLQELTSRLEPFTITGGSGSFMDDGRVGSTSMLARQVKIKLVSDDPDVPRTCNNILVSVHAIATFSALDDFLRPRIGSRQARGPQSPSTVPSANQQRAESRLKDKLRSFASRVSEVLGGTSDGEIDSDDDSETDLLDSIFGARRSLSSNASDTDTPRRDSVVDLKTDDARTPVESASSDTVPAAAASTPSKEEEKEKPVTSPSPDDKEKPKEPEATSTPGPSTSSSSVPPTSGSRKRSKGSSSGLPHPSSSSTMAPSSSQDWHLEFSIGDIPVESDKTIYAAVHMFEENLPTKSRSVWSNVYTVKYKRVPGPKPKKTTSLSSSSLCDSADSKRNLFTKELPMSLAKDEVFANVLVILRSLYNLNSQGTDLFQSDKCAISVLPPAYFINPKLTAKLNRQLEEPLLVASSCLPDWALSLPKELPFLFPFETRQLFLQSTSFGYSRSINRWNSRTGSDRRDDQPPLGRVQRQKVRIQRQKMLEAAKKVMNMFGPERSMLEIEYFEEVGTGLGPTLEFYSSVSKEFRKKGLNMWRDEKPSEGEYVISALGLFPSPMTTDFADTKDGKNRLELWKTLGTFCAKAMLDSRLIDLPFSIFFFKRLFSPSSSFGLYALKDIDPQLHKSLVSLQEYAVLKKKVYADDTLSNADKESKVKEIRIKDVAVDDLCLDFTLPGYNEVELKPKGADISVTIFNIEEYIQGVINTTVGSGVQKQFKSFKEGFNLVFPVDDLKLFTEEELSMMFGSGEEDWSYDALAEAVKADHGYTMNSKTIKNLLKVLSELDSAEKREFSQWLTGSPKLPIGGFKNLNPAFTIVRKSVESPLTADDYLPSVMTCVNYLKLPDYSSLEVMKKKLLTAIKEGQGSFLLS